jgi:hypothetical protein
VLTVKMSVYSDLSNRESKTRTRTTIGVYCLCVCFPFFEE